LEQLETSLDWQKLKIKIWDDFVPYEKFNQQFYDNEVVKIIDGFDKLIPEISKAEVVARTTPKYHRLNELLLNFNTQLQDCKELFLIRAMTR